MPKPNKHRGSRLDDLLREEGLYDEVRLDTLIRAASAVGREIRITLE